MTIPSPPLTDNFCSGEEHISRCRLVANLFVSHGFQLSSQGLLVWWSPDTPNERRETKQSG